MSLDLNNFHSILQAKRAEPLASSSGRDEIRVENAAEEFDRLQQQMNREVAIRNLDREARLLKNVEEALFRIEIGTFGVCLLCEEEIPEKRLNALPWARHCLGCQEKIDRRNAKGELDNSGILKPAA